MSRGVVIEQRKMISKLFPTVKSPVLKEKITYQDTECTAITNRNAGGLLKNGL